MAVPKNPPEWAKAISAVGRTMAQQPTTPVGEMAPRLLLSVPTGQYVAWMLANGALQAPPKLGPDPVIGDKVVAWLNKRLLDVTVKPYGVNQWEINDEGAKRGEIGERVPGTLLPIDVPENRGVGRPTKEYRVRLAEIPGMKFNSSIYYSEQCMSPVVIIGDGQEYLQNQRDEIVDIANSWLDDKTSILLDQDTLQVSNPDRILFHPFMILGPNVAKANPWIRALTPRLVIVTRWSYFRRMDPSLFAGAPMIVLANRRVGDNWNAIDETDEYQTLTPAFKELKLGSFPNGIFARKFSTRVNAPVDDDDEEREI
jgi:hypothetical protein